MYMYIYIHTYIHTYIHASRLRFDATYIQSERSTRALIKLYGPVGICTRDDDEDDTAWLPIVLAAPAKPKHFALYI